MEQGKQGSTRTPNGLRAECDVAHMSAGPIHVSHTS
jgi:hypothetical protein